MAFPPADRYSDLSVLIVDDDELQSQVLASVLRAEGFRVDTVSGGLSCVWAVRDGSYDVVLLDYRLPEIDGRAIAGLINDLMGPAARPILIALTAAPDVLIERESKAGKSFDAILAKSSDFQSLVAALKSNVLSVSDKPTRQAAKSSLLLRDWVDYDLDPTPPSERNPDDKADPARILVVEDDELQRRIITSVLQGCGHVVDTASDGLDAVRRIRDGCYDLVVVDYTLPEMDGLMAGRLIHDLMRESVRPRLVALTATPERLREKEGVARSAFDEIIQKSSDWGGLTGAVAHHLKSSPNLHIKRAIARD